MLFQRAAGRRQLDAARAPAAERSRKIRHRAGADLSRRVPSPEEVSDPARTPGGRAGIYSTRGRRAGAGTTAMRVRLRHPSTRGPRDNRMPEGSVGSAQASYGRNAEARCCCRGSAAWRYRQHDSGPSDLCFPYEFRLLRRWPSICQQAKPVRAHSERCAPTGPQAQGLFPPEKPREI